MSHIKSRTMTGSDKLKWDGLSSTFDEFSKDLEGTMTKAGMGYLLKEQVIKDFKKKGDAIAKDEQFFMDHGIVHAQFIRDSECLYGTLLSATKKFESAHIIDNKDTQDGL